MRSNPIACDEPGGLEETGERVCALKDLLDNDSLRKLVERVPSLPTLPAVYAQLVRELRAPDASLKRAGALISRDIGLASKVLRLVNSSFFGLRRTVSQPSEAVMLLGLDAVASLVLSAHLFSQLDGVHVRGLSPARLWSHSARVGSFARAVARVEGRGQASAGDCFTAGLMHDAGKVVLALAVPSWYEEALAEAEMSRVSEAVAERMVFGTTHAEAGAYLLGLWGLPEDVVEAVAFHHRPGAGSANAFTPLTAVHAANCLEHELSPDGDAERSHEVPDEAYLASVGCGGRLDFWREVCADAED